DHQVVPGTGGEKEALVLGQGDRLRGRRETAIGTDSCAGRDLSVRRGSLGGCGIRDAVKQRADLWGVDQGVVIAGHDIRDQRKQLAMLHHLDGWLPVACNAASHRLLPELPVASGPCGTSRGPSTLS